MYWQTLLIQTDNVPPLLSWRCKSLTVFLTAPSLLEKATTSPLLFMDVNTASRLSQSLIYSLPMVTNWATELWRSHFLLFLNKISVLGGSYHNTRAATAAAIWELVWTVSQGLSLHCRSLKWHWCLPVIVIGVERQQHHHRGEQNRKGFS